MKAKIKSNMLSKLERVVWKWAREHDSENPKGSLEDVTQHGCQSGIVTDLIYYVDTVKFYKKHRKDINELLVNALEGSGLSINELFGDKWERDDPLGQDDINQNLLAWFGFEESANNILMLLENLEEEI